HDAVRRGLCLSQRFDLASDQHDLLDAEAGVDGRQSFVEQLGEMDRIAVGPGGADAQAGASLVDALDDEIEPPHSFAAPLQLPTEIMREVEHDCLKSLDPTNRL